MWIAFLRSDGYDQYGSELWPLKSMGGREYTGVPFCFFSESGRLQVAMVVTYTTW